MTTNASLNYPGAVVRFFDFITSLFILSTFLWAEKNMSSDLPLQDKVIFTLSLEIMGVLLICCSIVHDGIANPKPKKSSVYVGALGGVLLFSFLLFPLVYMLITSIF